MLARFTLEEDLERTSNDHNHVVLSAGTYSTLVSVTSQQSSVEEYIYQLVFRFEFLDRDGTAWSHESNIPIVFLWFDGDKAEGWENYRGFSPHAEAFGHIDGRGLLDLRFIDRGERMSVRLKRLTTFCAVMLREPDMIVRHAWRDYFVDPAPTFSPMYWVYLARPYECVFMVPRTRKRIVFLNRINDPSHELLGLDRSPVTVASGE